jgi:cyclohexyl-isocyanide hydratase
MLKGKEATTYHTAFDELATYGVNVLSSKVVRDGKMITAAGVRSGLELGFYLLRELFGAPIAQEVAEKIEYTIDIMHL